MAVNEGRLCMGCMSPLPGDGRCGVCGYDQKMTVNTGFLPPESVMASRYIIGRLAGSDPEGAWYVGYDKLESTRVWLREYAPPGIVRRDPNDFSIRPIPGSEAQYKALMSDFEDLCRSIQRLPPSEKVIPITDMTRANNTVYAVYRYIKTITLDAFLQRSGGKLSWRHTKKLLMPLYHTVANVHKMGLIHRGLSPQTIHLDQSGSLWLSCFTIAAARTNKSELSAQLFDGYAAPEQYSLNSWQGTWTDVYALGAITYRVVTGDAPPPALDRVYGDDLLDSQIITAEMNECTVNAINKALAFEVEDRTQTAEQFISGLLATEGSNTAVYTAPRKSYESPDDSLRRQEVRRSAAARAEQDAAPAPKSRFADYEGGIDLIPAPSPKKAEPTPARGREDSRRKKKKRAHPVLSLIFSALVATALLGFGVYYVASHFLPDLIFPDTSASEPDDNHSADAGTDFVGDGGADDGNVPRFVGTKADSIRSNEKLAKRFTLEYVEKFNADYEAGVVCGQTPLEGEPLSEGGTVTLTISKGIEKVKMPDVAGLSVEEAVSALGALGVKFDIIPVYGANYEPDVIVRTDTAPGTMVEVGGNPVMLFIKNVEAAASSEEERLPEEEDDRGRGNSSSSQIPRKRAASAKSSNSKPKQYTSTDENGNKYVITENTDD